jgi:FkbM family methyltransferase
MTTWKDQFASQHGEDSWLCDHWGLLRLPDYGFFVEFGAGDGKYISNTWWLEKYRGWHGLLCEPDPRSADKITEREHSIIERVAVGTQGTTRLGCTEDPYLSGMLRTADAPRAVVRAQSFIDVPSVPLSNLLEKYGVEGIDLISIDTEGTELESWRTLNLKRWRPRVAIIELITWGLPDASEEIITAMNEDGYTLVKRTFHNGIFLDSASCRNSSLAYFVTRMRSEKAASET